MQNAKETVSNIAASAKAGMDKTKAVVQEKVEKMTAHDPMERDMATQRKEDRIAQAEMNKQQTREHNAATTGHAAGVPGTGGTYTTHSGTGTHGHVHGMTGTGGETYSHGGVHGMIGTGGETYSTHGGMHGMTGTGSETYSTHGGVPGMTGTGGETYSTHGHGGVHGMTGTGGDTYSQGGGPGMTGTGESYTRSATGTQGQYSTGMHQMSGQGTGHTMGGRVVEGAVGSHPIGKATGTGGTAGSHPTGYGTGTEGNYS